MEDYEKRLAGALNEMSVCLGLREKRWSEMWRDAFAEAQRLFESGAEVRAKYDFVTRIRYYYGGMGPFNDIWIPDECEQLKTDLYQLIKDARRQYWRQLGNEWHDYSRFQLLPNGTKAKLIPGKVMFKESESYQVIVSDNPKAAEQVWTILRCDGPDITNMPTYTISSDNHFGSARQEALELV